MVNATFSFIYLQIHNQLFAFIKHSVRLGNIIWWCESTAETELAWYDRLRSRDLSFGEQIWLCLGIESGRRVLVRYLLTVFAFELNRKGNKGRVAELSRSGVTFAFRFFAAAYFFQLCTGTFYERFNGYLITSTYVVALKLLTLLTCTFVLSNSKKYFRRDTSNLLEYSLVFVLAVLFRRLLVRASNFRSAFRAIVGFSLNVYVLILFDALKSGGREAGVKYYFLSTFSSGLMLYGIFFILRLTGSLNFFEVGQALVFRTDDYYTAVPFRLQRGLTFILTGIFFKLSAFPGHLWAAEVYSGSSDSIRAFFRLPMKVAVISFLMSVLRVAFQPIVVAWQPLLRISSAGSIVWGAFGALGEKNTKRFLAYAAINQIGFLLLGFVSASSVGCRATLIYLFIYVARNFGFLTRFLNSSRKGAPGLVYLTDFRSLGQQNWLISWSSARRLFSRAGIPPLAGFFGKYFLLRSVQLEGLYTLVVVALATSLVSSYYYLRVIKIFWFEGKTARVDVTCELPIAQQVILFASERVLWSFIRFSGAIFSVVQLLAHTLIAPSF